MSVATEEAATAAIEVAARALHLPTVRTEAPRLAEVAARERLTHRGYLAEVLTAEVDDRQTRRRARRVGEARFPRMKRLADFDPEASGRVTPAMLATLAAGSFIEAGDPLCLIGDSGTGKSHLLIGTGVAACEAGRRVRYVTCASLVNELAEAADDHVLSRVVARYGRLELLCLDELCYVHLDPRGAELLFQVITEREERASIAVASNASFSEWGSTFTDPRLAAAVVDRLTFRAHIIETGTTSYRLAASQRRRTSRSSDPKGTVTS
ncbi:MAG: IS21-like element helper ATPase IstB [Candidatus Dormibacteria bacterium]